MRFLSNKQFSPKPQTKKLQRKDVKQARAEVGLVYSAGPEKHREHGSSAPRKVDICQEVKPKIVNHFRMVELEIKLFCGK